MKTVGIACDNYKIAKFKKELEAKGFTNYIITELLVNTSLIKITAPKDKIEEVRNICTLVEMHFKQSN